MKVFFKIFYYICLGFLAIVAVLLVVSAFPITGNYKVLMVLSGSMEPEIKSGSVVVVKPADDYRIGDVITFNGLKQKELITHRIEEIKVVGGTPVYITKGDANNAPDRKEVSKKDIIGKVLFDISYLGYVVNFAQKPAGFLLLIITPAIVVIIDEGKKVYEEIKKKKKNSVNKL